MKLMRNRPIISNVSSFGESRYGESGFSPPSVDDGILANWSGSPPVTPGQLAWMSVSQDTLGDYEEFDGR